MIETVGQLMDVLNTLPPDMKVIAVDDGEPLDIHGVEVDPLDGDLMIVLDRP
jgi:hypothetical protein